MSQAACILSVMGTACNSSAQSVLQSRAAIFPISTPALFGVTGDDIGVLPSDISLFRVGPVTIRPRFNYTYTYATGLQSAPGQSANSQVQSFAPGVTLALGSHWTLDYAPSITHYSSQQFHDSLDQNFTLSGHATYEDWTFGVTQTYSIASDPLVETGAQTDTESFGTSLTASYAINSKISTDMSFNQSYSAASQYVGSFSWSFSDNLNYQFFPRLTGGIGVVLGYCAVSEGSDLSNEQLNAHVSWHVFDKLNFLVSAGAEDQQYLGGGVPSTITPVFSASLQEHLFAHTDLALTASKTLSPSYFQSQSSDATALGFTISQRFFKRFVVNGNASYNFTEYIASGTSVPTTNSVGVPVSNVGRTDSGYSLGAGVSWSFLKRANAGLNYSFSKNNSSGTGFSFGSQQVSANLGYSF